MNASVFYQTDGFNECLITNFTGIKAFTIMYTMIYQTTRKRYVVKHNLITEVYLMTVMETTTCFGLYWPSSGCLGNLRASYMHARMRGEEISTYA